MNEIVEKINTLAEPWTFFVWNTSWQSALVAAILICVVAFGSKLSASIRYSILIVALLKFAAPPFLAFPTGAFSTMPETHLAQRLNRLNPPTTIAEPIKKNATTAESKQFHALNQLDVRLDFQAAEPLPSIASATAPTGTATKRLSLWSWLMLAHLAGTIVLGSFVCIGLFRLIRLTRRASDVVDPNVIKQYRTLCGRLGLQRIPRLVESHDVSIPISFGCLRPIVMMPCGLVSQEPFATVAMSHELSHHRRWDPWFNWLQNVLLVCWWFNPTIWILNRLIRQQREICCDDLLLDRQLTDSETYSQSLVELAKMSSNPFAGNLAAAFGITDHSLTHRLRRIMDPAVERETSVSRSGIAILMLLCLVCLPGLRNSIAEITSAPNSLQVESNRPVAATSGGRESVDEVIAIQNQMEGEPQRTSENLAVQDENRSANLTSIVGRCVDENNDPFTTASVRLFHYGQDANDSSSITQVELRSTLCNTKGQFEFKNIARSGKFGSWAVVAQHPGRATCSKYVSTETLGNQPLTLKMRPAATLKGRIVNADGDAVSGALVTAGSPLLISIPGINAAITDAKGNYEISDLNPFDIAEQKPQPTGDGTFSMFSHFIGKIQHPDYARTNFSYSKAPDVANVTVERPATVEGNVLLKESKLPATGSIIEFWNDVIASDSWTRSTVDAKGRFRIESLPPGKYRVNIKLEGRPNLALPEVQLSVGINRKNFSMERGGFVNGRMINSLTEEPIRLAPGDIMQVSEMDKGGYSYAGMNTVNVNSNGSFKLLLPVGQRYLGTYLGSKWIGVNTDRLGTKGIEVLDGKNTEIEIRIKPREKEKPLVPLSKSAASDLAEQVATAAIKQLGGWVTVESIGGKEHVVEVNMVYHEDEKIGRSDNRIICDECLSYVKKFPKLKRLMLYREQATDDGLANLRGMDSLEEIYIWNASAVSDTGAAHIAQLKNLKTIAIQNSKLTDKALKHFSGLPSIKKLSLQGNHFTNKGLEYLQEKTQLTELVMGLGTNEITDEGLRYISKLTNLERLGLQNSKVTDAGLEHLQSLKNLRELWIGSNDISKEGLSNLRKTLPKLKSSF